MEELQALCIQLGVEKIDTRQVAARSGETCDQTQLDRVLGDDEEWS
jgi:hypothetical protein